MENSVSNSKKKSKVKHNESSTDGQDIEHTTSLNESYTDNLNKKSKKKKNRESKEFKEETPDHSLESIEHSPYMESQQISSKKKKKRSSEISEVSENVSIISDTIESLPTENGLEHKKKKKKQNEIGESVDYTVSNSKDTLNITSSEASSKKKKKKERLNDSILPDSEVLDSVNIVDTDITPINQSLDTDNAAKSHKKSKKKKKRTHSETEETSILEVSSTANSELLISSPTSEEKINKSPNKSDVSSPTDSSTKQSHANDQSTSQSEDKPHKEQSPRSKKRIKDDINTNISTTQEEPEDDLDIDLRKQRGSMKKVPNWMKKEMSKKEKFSDAMQRIENVPVGSKGRAYTISIAIPASILEETCLLHELRTYIVGQLARIACIYSVDEIVVYNDGCWKGSSDFAVDEFLGMMKMILEYQECPQYLRRDIFPMHKFLSMTGVLNALNAPHHLLNYQWCIYREGIVKDRETTEKTKSLAYVGIKTLITIDRNLEPGTRVTLKLPRELPMSNKVSGTVVSSEEPREKCGLYWGYTVRVADSLTQVLKGDRLPPYDLCIGTSDKGKNERSSKFKPFKHAIVVFGGVEGIEAAIENDKEMKGKKASDIFNHYLNTCPNQQSRTIRTEEAVMITMTKLSDKLIAMGRRSV